MKFRLILSAVLLALVAAVVLLRDELGTPTAVAPTPVDSTPGGVPTAPPPPVFNL